MRLTVIILFSFLLMAGLTNTTLAAGAEKEKVKEPAKEAEPELDGQALTFDRNKGNCLACHAIPKEPKVTSPGNIGPPLVGIKERFPDRAKLRAHIWDATAVNPHTAMPPFGKNKILTEPEIDRVVDYIYSK